MNSGRMRIVHLVEAFSGGVKTYLCGVLPELVERGCDVTLVCSLKRAEPGGQKCAAELRDKGVVVHVMEMAQKIRPLRDMPAVFLLWRLLLRNNFSVVHTHCSKAGALGRVAAVLAGVRVIVHSPHCLAFLRCRGRLRRFLFLLCERLLGRFTTRLIAVSRYEAAVAVRMGIVSGDRCVHVSNGLACSRSFEEGTAMTIGVPEDYAVVTCVCRLVEYKGVFRFLEAAQLSRSPQAVFVISGDGPLRKAAEQFVIEHKLGNRVRLLGHVPDIEGLYAISDLVVLCSDAEGQPYVILEAMRAGCAVVATKVAGNAELIVDGQTGRLAEPNAASVASAIDEMLGDKQKRERYAENALAYVKSHHRLEDQVSKLVEIYANCIYSQGKHAKERTRHRESRSKRSFAGQNSL